VYVQLLVRCHAFSVTLYLFLRFRIITLSVYGALVEFTYSAVAAGAADIAGRPPSGVATDDEPRGAVRCFSRR
jgi:hypothetical protein